jgi:hypothetical protein
LNKTKGCLIANFATVPFILTELLSPHQLEKAELHRQTSFAWFSPFADKVCGSVQIVAETSPLSLPGSLPVVTQKRSFLQILINACWTPFIATLSHD